jgi:hypothetical protein
VVNHALKPLLQSLYGDSASVQEVRHHVRIAANRTLHNFFTEKNRYKYVVSGFFPASRLTLKPGLLLAAYQAYSDRTNGRGKVGRPVK